MLHLPKRPVFAQTVGLSPLDGVRPCRRGSGRHRQPPMPTPVATHDPPCPASLGAHRASSDFACLKGLSIPYKVRSRRRSWRVLMVFDGRALTPPSAARDILIRGLAQHRGNRSGLRTPDRCSHSPQCPTIPGGVMQVLVIADGAEAGTAHCAPARSQSPPSLQARNPHASQVFPFSVVSDYAGGLGEDTGDCRSHERWHAYLVRGTTASTVLLTTASTLSDFVPITGLPILRRVRLCRSAR